MSGKTLNLCFSIKYSCRHAYYFRDKFMKLFILNASLVCVRASLKDCVRV